MATPVIMPRQGQSVESCIIGKWHKQKGDKINVGDILFTYETDKATFDEEAKVEGILLDVFYEEGDDVECLLNVCVIGNEGESTAEFNPNTGDKTDQAVQDTPATETAAPPETTPASSAADTVQRAEGEFIKVSPRARNLAVKSGVDITVTPASGPGGRIIERDVNAMIDNKQFATPAAAALAAGKSLTGTGIGGRVTTADVAAGNAAPAAVAAVAAGPDFTEVPHANIRKVIARAMHQSLSTMAQLTLNASFDATEIMQYRAKLKTSKERLALSNITLNDIILYAVSRTVLNHPECNAHYYDDKMVFFRNAHLGMAVDTPRGLMVPTIHNANLLSLNEISIAAKNAAEQSQAGTISPDALKGGTFTITNLGTLDIETFTPVINPPQTCILGVNTITTKIREVEGEIKTYPSMALSLTFDHRALDGAPAARFLKDLKINLENFSALLVK